MRSTVSEKNKNLALWIEAAISCLILASSAQLTMIINNRSEHSDQIFQPPPSRRTTTSSQHARPSGVLRRRSDGLECAAWRPPRPVAQCRQFPEDTKDASVSECTWTLSALEALRNALYKFKTYLLTYSMAKSAKLIQISYDLVKLLPKVRCHTEGPLCSYLRLSMEDKLHQMLLRAKYKKSQL